MDNILGISIGTRNVGIAVIHLRKLRDYRIRTFAGKWTEEKREVIFSVVESLIKKYQITTVMLKLPPSSHRSANQDELVDGIRELGLWFGAKTFRFTMRDINCSYSLPANKGKKAMIDAIVEKYPELLERSGKKGKRAQAYNAKLFEAIACADIALRSH